MNKEEILQAIQDKQEEIDNFELDTSDYEDSYCDMLDDCYPELFNMSPSRILRECDPTAYNCGWNDYVDSIEVEEEDEYILLVEELEKLENELEELEED